MPWSGSSRIVSYLFSHGHFLNGFVREQGTLSFGWNHPFRLAEKDTIYSLWNLDLTSNRYTNDIPCPTNNKINEKELKYNDISLINIANTSCQSLGRFSSDPTAFVKCLFRNQHLAFSALHTDVLMKKRNCAGPTEVCLIVFSQKRMI